MKKITVLFVLLFAVFQSFAADWTAIRSNNPAPGQKVLISSGLDQSIITFKTDGFYSTTVNTPQGPAVVISLDEATPLLLQGAPDLPKLTASVIIPDLAEMQIEVISAQYQDFENIFVAPGKGNLTRDIDPSSVPYTFGPEYSTNAFFPGNLAGTREPYIIRDYRGQTVIAYPFQYNAVTRTLRVYTDITVKISSTGHLGENPLYRNENDESIDAGFNAVYQRHFLNAMENGSRYNPVPEYGNMLVICYSAFLDAIQPYVEWKKQIGYPVEVVDVATIGNSNAIKSFIANYYNTKGLTFVLLVGDAAQVPASSTSAGDSDNNYAYVVGSDHYPDLFIGRFSAENVNQVQTQVQRTIMYEQNPPVSADWFSVCTGIASNQGPGDDNELDYEHIRNISNNKLIPFTYTFANELFDGSQGGNDEGGNPTPTQVAADVNAGTSIINYTGHGSDGSWGTSGFSISDVNNLVNDNLLPYVWSVACVNGNFVGGTCFAEAWLRATHNGNPTGAVAFLGSTINQSWDPPMAGQDEMNDILVETYPNQINRTFGALSMHGCMLMNDEFGSAGVEMTDTWTCFGDPSVMVRTAMPVTMTVTHDPVLFLGATQTMILCDHNGARATLSLNGTRLATGVVANGSVTLEFAPLGEIGTADLTITAFNTLPYMMGIDIIPATGPYVVMNSYQIADEAGNNNGLPDYNESVGMAVELENVGIQDATDVLVTLVTDDPYITITDYSETYPLIPAGSTASVEDAFAFSISSDVPDQHQVMFTITSIMGDETWQSIFMLNANAPILNINSITILDSEEGNGDGELDPGERADLVINYNNTGHAVAYDVNLFMEGQSGFVEISNPDQNFTSIGFFGVFNKTYTVVVDEDVPEGIKIDFVNELTMGDFMMNRVFPLRVSAKVEDFETGNLEQFNWQTGGNAAWQVVNSYPYEGFYCLKSGTISHSQTSEISLVYNVMEADSIIFYRKVSSESSDQLKFYINNQVAGSWSGTTGGWKREAFAVSAGQKTFKWAYEKNNMGSGGSDCAWLDYIILPSPFALTIWAGSDNSVCNGNSYEINDAYGTDYELIEWISSGSGTFDDNTSMHPLYTPSGQDLSTGQVTLTLNLWDDEGSMVTDEMQLGFRDVPSAPEQPDGLSYVDVATVETSDYTTDIMEEADDYNWTIDPPVAGVIIGNENTATVSWNAEFTGVAYISVTGGNACGNGEVSAALEVQVVNSIVGLTEPDDPAVSIFPNPASGIIHVNLSSIGSYNPVVRLVNMIGIELFNSGVVNNVSDIVFPVSGYAPGVYLLSVNTGDRQLTRKIIIK